MGSGAEVFRILFEGHVAVKFVVDPRSGRIVDANEAAASFYGWTRSRLRTMRVQEINTLPPDEVAREMEMARTGRKTFFEFRHRMADGSSRDVAIFSSAFPYRRRKLLLSIVLDVTDRKRAEAAFRESQQRLALFVEHAPAAIAMFDREMRYLAASRRWLIDHGLGERDVIGLSHYEVFPDVPGRWREIHRRCLAGAVERAVKDPFPRGDGTVDWVTWEIRPWRTAAGDVGGLMLFSEVVTDRVKLDARLEKASRLAAMGTLVAGVAHEVNNPLTSVLAGQAFALDGARALRERIASGEILDPAGSAEELDGMVEALVDAQAGGERIARIVRDLAVLGRPDATRARVRLADVVDDAMRWLPHGVLRGATLEISKDDAPDVLASPGQLTQVVVNLMTNAAKSIPAGRAGVVAVRIGARSASTAFIEVSDDGQGIAPEVMRRIFDPFFTTRQPGDGMGLGLAICHAIVTAHGGTIGARSEIGKGSTFDVELPATPPGPTPG